MTSPFVELLGNTLKSKGAETVPTAEALQGKVAVGLYFSAHWCGPCRGFTPQLAKAYTETLKAKGMEIVFVSSDRDEPAFDSYHGEQPWLALPYSERKIKETLSKKYKVRGIPSFVILDGATGATITTDGRSAIMEDSPKFEAFPWKPPTIWEALGDEFLEGTDGDTVSIEDVKKDAKYIGLYFSAHWCGPCRSFTPTLIKSYTEHLKAKGLQIIFVSSDRDQASFLDYFKDMPWLAIPNGDKRKSALNKLFEVQGIPTFVLIDAATGQTITADARGDVGRDPTGEEFPWHPKALNDIATGKGIDKLNEELCLCVMMDKCDKATQDAATAVLTPIAEKARDSGASTGFFTACSGDGPVSQIRQLCSLEATGAPQIVLLDIPDNGGFYVSPASEVTAETINGFLEGYKAGALERKQLG